MSKTIYFVPQEMAQISNSMYPVGSDCCLVGVDSSGTRYKTLMRFELPQTLLLEDVRDSLLKLFIRYSTVTANLPFKVKVYRIVEDWDCHTVGWDNQPKYDHDAVATIHIRPCEDKSEVRVELHRLASRWIDGHWRNFGIMLDAADLPERNTLVCFASLRDDDSDHWPELAVALEEDNNRHCRCYPPYRPAPFRMSPCCPPSGYPNPCGAPPCYRMPFNPMSCNPMSNPPFRQAAYPYRDKRCVGCQQHPPVWPYGAPQQGYQGHQDYQEQGMMEFMEPEADEEDWYRAGRPE